MKSRLTEDYMAATAAVDALTLRVDVMHLHEYASLFESIDKAEDLAEEAHSARRACRRARLLS